MHKAKKKISARGGGVSEGKFKFTDGQCQKES